MPRPVAAPFDLLANSVLPSIPASEIGARRSDVIEVRQCPHAGTADSAAERHREQQSNEISNLPETAFGIAGALPQVFGRSNQQ